ncbi:hypothetical protein [Sphingosinicella sp.]|uniref:hypothetical protein n=1 Tax=Sphingosinicella sp. TaxID=1917971 RepID=UPI001810197D|nr:hypothetical protein [Sphingosinicella sp.]MBA4757734.1 hypothetical protein [Sphingosinicella sp.]
MGLFDFWSIFRRSFLRAGEIAFFAQVLEFLGLFEGLNELIWSKQHFPGFLLIACAGSFLYDIVHVVTRPEIPLLPEKPCGQDEPRLPLEQEI